MGADFSQIPIRDIHLPDAVSWWPLAPGWWMLLLLIIVIAVATYLYLRYRQKPRIQQQALQELAQIKQAYLTKYDAVVFVKDLSALLRRVSVSYFPRQEVAGLTGKAWLEFLDRVLSAKNVAGDIRFNSPSGRALITLPYSRHARHLRVDVAELENIALNWIQALPSRVQSGEA